MDYAPYIQALGQRARAASRLLAGTSDATKRTILHKLADALITATPDILAANALDLAAAKDNALAQPLVERLKLDEKKVAKMAAAVRDIAAQTDPVGQVIEGYVRPNGLRIERRRVPLGVVLFFYESRPNVTTDAAALCIKSGNAVILRGGKEALHSNLALAKVVQSAIAAVDNRLADAVQVIEITDRALVPPLLKLDKYIDLVVPRGGESLIRAVVAESTIPVVKHYNGNCHIYVDRTSADIAADVVNVCVNAKTSYPGGAVCNTVETLLFHQDIAPTLLPKVCAALAAKGVEIRGCPATRALFPAAIPATELDWDTEYLAFIVAVKVVPSIDAAIDHINHHGSHHTDAILTTDTRAADHFTTYVDSASVMINASTRFADGGEYGLGAELGISTDKLHARGPMGATDMTTYKWVVTGNGHVR
jgi:glutamate-5-semialdehyde dehydrogenase